MNCWKTVNLNKEFGINRLYLLSFLIGLLTFIFLYVPFSVMHNSVNINEFGIFPLMIALFFLPIIHAFMHILPLNMMNNRAKLLYSRKNVLFPYVNYYTKKPVPKKVSLLAAFAPTMFITIPGIMATYIFAEYYVYFLLFTSVHIAITFTDFLYIINISKAPKQSLIENNNNEFAILIKSHN
ncbi:DUF3267 domain-containing protein [Virgibacillus doumboii]|uniref:DUF3267 domain-containing protein n=1 Tax=Virgibacillus doumboii TaxID=2697503 RepID=UPI0013DF4A96|nr:DUF3267 domain-containing protein [Virgibacillus doumboii]